MMNWTIQIRCSTLESVPKMSSYKIYNLFSKILVLFFFQQNLSYQDNKYFYVNALS